MTVLPGYVETRMTKDMDLPKWLTVSPEYVGKRIFNNTSILLQRYVCKVQ